MPLFLPLQTNCGYNFSNVEIKHSTSNPEVSHDEYTVNQSLSVGAVIHSIAGQLEPST